MSRETGAYLRLLLITAFWGSAFPITRMAVVDVPPATVAALRLVLSTVFFAGVLGFGGHLTLERIRHVWRLHGLHLVPLGVIGMGLYLALINYGISILGAAQAGLLAPTSYPLLTAVLARLLLRDPLYPSKVAGLLLALAGVALIIGAAVYGGLPWRPTGYLFIALGATGFALYSVYGPLLMRTMTPLEANTWIGLVGSIGLLPWIWFEQPGAALISAGPGFWLTIIYLSVFVQALSYLWWYEGIQVIGPSRTAVFTYVVPIWAVTLSLLILREPVTIGQVIGGLMAVGGVALVNWQGGRAGIEVQSRRMET